MENKINEYAELLDDKTGIVSIINEMKKQKQNAKSSYEKQLSHIKELATSIKRKKTVILLGMGASHFVNQLFEFELRKLDYKAIAITASDYLYSPLKEPDAVFIFTSQSGESIETVKCLDLVKNNLKYSFTLNNESTIGKNTVSIVGDGGIEKAFAGTRSVMLSASLIAYVLAELGAFCVEDVFNSIIYNQKYDQSFKTGVKCLESSSLLIATGRGIAFPLANLFSLGAQELSGLPFLGYETGQFRHGPREMVKSNTTIVVFRQSGILGELVKSFEEIRAQSNCNLIVIDFSNLEPIDNSITIKSATGNNILAALSVMELFQTFMICYSCTKNKLTGIPKYSQKITNKE